MSATPRPAPTFSGASSIARWVAEARTRAGNLMWRHIALGMELEQRGEGLARVVAMLSYRIALLEQDKASRDPWAGVFGP